MSARRREAHGAAKVRVAASLALSLIFILACCDPLQKIRFSKRCTHGKVPVGAGEAGVIGVVSDWWVALVIFSQVWCLFAELVGVPLKKVNRGAQNTLPQ